MSDRIPATTHLAMALINYVCARRDCSEILESLPLEKYIDRELAFDRGAAGDGILTLKADGRDVFVLNELGTITNLDQGGEYSFCDSIPELACRNPAKTIIAALFGKEELQQTSLTPKEEEEAKKLREAMGLGSRPDPEVAKPGEPSPPPPRGGTFLYDRWKGWRLGGEVFFNYYQVPRGGAKLWLGLRQDRWDFRVGIQGESLRNSGGREDFSVGLSLEPIFHLRERPLIFDPYLHLPSLGFYRLFAGEESGISFSPLGGGLQFHLHDSWAIYAGARGMAKLGFDAKPELGLDVPLGLSGKF